ncbi:hypothetical protein SBA7_20011 [Candidatus Sulfotelmatobacter sp. SbA7]|nr:hypothetical protein SBA7_20011 [Candidatus Sulfotelmatobacter sp. SbA7]
MIVWSAKAQAAGHATLDSGWRSAGVPGTPGFGVMGWRTSALRKDLTFSANGKGTASQLAEKVVRESHFEREMHRES